MQAIMNSYRNKSKFDWKKKYALILFEQMMGDEECFSLTAVFWSPLNGSLWHYRNSKNFYLLKSIRSVAISLLEAYLKFWTMAKCKKPEGRRWRRQALEPVTNEGCQILALMGREKLVVILGGCPLNVPESDFRNKVS